MKIAVVLFNLGGPDNLESVKPFLYNLFNDKNIITLPYPFRYFLAKLISGLRDKTAQEIYKEIGGKSPILEETEAQRKSLEKLLKKKGCEFKVFTSMRYWHPRSKQVIKDVYDFSPDKIILLPLYPQYSTTTTFSSFEEWHKLAKNYPKCETLEICCYPTEKNFIKAHKGLIKKDLKKFKTKNYRILFSAHGLPQDIVDKGDPYEWQVNHTVKNLVSDLNIKDLDYKICFQSKVGPKKWLEPSLDQEIKNAANDNKDIMIVPIAFVSEHSETLVELDIEYKKMAKELGIKQYVRVEALRTNKDFIDSLKNLCLEAIEREESFYKNKICPSNFSKCICIN